MVAGSRHMQFQCIQRPPAAAWLLQAPSGLCVPRPAVGVPSVCVVIPMARHPVPCVGVSASRSPLKSGSGIVGRRGGGSSVRAFGVGCLSAPRIDSNYKVEVHKSIISEVLTLQGTPLCQHTPFGL